MCCHRKKFPLTGQNFKSKKEIPCHMKKLLLQDDLCCHWTNFLRQEEISFHRRHFLSQEGRNILSQEGISCHRKKTPVIGSSLLDSVSWMFNKCIFFLSGVVKYFIRLFSPLYPTLCCILICQGNVVSGYININYHLTESPNIILGLTAPPPSPNVLM